MQSLHSKVVVFTGHCSFSLGSVVISSKLVCFTVLLSSGLWLLCETADSEETSVLLKDMGSTSSDSIGLEFFEARFVAEM